MAVKIESHMKNLHEVLDIIEVMCDLQVNGIATSVPYLQGPPGAGKTECIRVLAEKNDDQFISCHFALKMPEDLGGIPQFTDTVVNGTKVLSTIWSFPEFMNSVYHESDIAKVKELGGLFIINKTTSKIRAAIPNISVKEFTNKTKGNSFQEKYKYQEDLEHLEDIKGDKKTRKVILLMDDMHRCGAFHMTALLEILTERKFRDYPVPNNVAFILAGNNSQKSGTQILHSAVVNRVSIMPIQTSFEHWKTEFALKNNIHMGIIGFLSNDKNKDKFHGEEQVDKPWPSPRTWTNFSNALKAFEKNYRHGKRDVPVDIIEYLACAHVGPQAAGEFIAHYKVFNRFPTDEIFEKVKKPEDFFPYLKQYDAFLQYSLAYACINHYLSIPSDERKKKKFPEVILNILTAYNLEKGGVAYPEIGIVIIKELQIILSSQKTQDEINYLLMEISTRRDPATGQTISDKMINSLIEVNQ